MTTNTLDTVPMVKDGVFKTLNPPTDTAGLLFNAFAR